MRTTRSNSFSPWMTCVVALPADGGLDNCFDVGNVHSIARDLVAIDLDDQAGLAEFPHHGELGKSGHLLAEIS